MMYNISLFEINYNLKLLLVIVALIRTVLPRQWRTEWGEVEFVHKNVGRFLSYHHLILVHETPIPIKHTFLLNFVFRDHLVSLAKLVLTDRRENKDFLEKKAALDKQDHVVLL